MSNIIEKYSKDDKLIIKLVHRYKSNNENLKEYNINVQLLDDAKYIRKWYLRKIRKMEYENKKLKLLLDKIKEMRNDK